MDVDWEMSVIEGKSHAHHLRTAYKFAYENSMDPRTKTGAIITNFGQDKVLGMGTNIVRPGLVLGRDYVESDLRDSPWKLKNMIHSENNCIENGKKVGNDLIGSIMYMFWTPCLPCAKEIVDSGISTYISHRQMIDRTPERWIQSCIEGVDLMKESGISVFMYDGKLGGVKSRMNDEEWEP
jgi:deoxycytidylate deaminase